jgi:hypothetical protein
MTFRLWLVAGMAAALAGCGTGPIDDAVADAPPVAEAGTELTPGGSDTCGAAAHAALIGRPGDAIDRSSLPRGARVVCHDCQVTMDFLPDRLNVRLDPQGRVAALDCG